ncbi:hypothetical protein EC973_003054 [Apophysomyces ossiformis]|uniref:Uncharacterized protein n=1 Tax=Apophysomyces ossiformis TaxID=679940 RepID=A0A8H7BM60_9FUNG|nr:hypothetical protein EC973_003054 [Apophysomyces ossiformis]
MKFINTLAVVTALSTLVAASPDIYTTKYTYINGVKIAALVDGVDRTVTGTLVVNGYVTSTYTRPHAAFRWNFPLLQAIIKLPGVHAILSKFRILSHIAHAIEPEFLSEVMMQAQSVDPNDTLPMLLQSAAEKAASLLEELTMSTTPQPAVSSQAVAATTNSKSLVSSSSVQAPAASIVSQLTQQRQAAASSELPAATENMPEDSHEPQAIKKETETIETSRNDDASDSSTRQTESSL